MRRVMRVCLIGVVIFGLTACGYKFSGGGELPGGIERVSVGIFENRSAETGVEGIISNDIINEFTRNGKTVARGSVGADAVISGAVLSVTNRSISRQSVYTVQERRVTVAISLRMIDAEGAVVWQASHISENEEYEVADDKMTTEQNKRAAILKLSKRLAEAAYYSMTEAF